MASVELLIEGVQCSYGSHPAVVKGVSFSVQKGQLLGILGPNGSGKSTLLRAIARTLEPTVGRVLLDDHDIFRLKAQEVARQMAVVSQENSFDFPFTVEELVLMGRLPHLRRFQREGSKDFKVVQEALEATNCIHLARRPITQLSGGEKQRVMIARALAQNPRVLLLDEPTSHLDINHQTEILDLISHLRNTLGITVIIVLHDLNLASEYCDHLVLLKSGKIFALGSPLDVITAENIANLYGGKVIVQPHPLHGRPQVTVLSQLKRRGGQLSTQVHVIGGGGMATPLLRELYQAGYQVTTGVLNMGDSDFRLAQSLAIPIIAAPPFSPLTESEHRQHLVMLKKAHWVILAPIPFGPGNTLNLEAVHQALDEGIPVIIVDDPPIQQRDFAGGTVQGSYQRLLTKGGIRVMDVGRVMEHLEREV